MELRNVKNEMETCDHLFCHTCLSSGRRLFPVTDYIELCSLIFISFKLVGIPKYILQNIQRKLSCQN